MKRLILLLLTFCPLSLQAQSDLQELATMWQAGQVVATKNIMPRNKYIAKIERRFLGMTPEGYYKVQEFYIDIGAPFFYKKYPKNTPYTAPYLLMNIEDVIRSQKEVSAPTPPASIHGSYVRYTDKGEVKFAGQYEQGKKTGFWRYYSGEKVYLTEQYKEGQLIQRIQAP